MYTLRVFYFVMAAGIGVYYWPAIIHHTSEFATTQGVQYALLAGLGTVAALGLRYPVQMLPILLFELTWKAIYLLAFALPLWSAGQINAAAAADIQAVLYPAAYRAETTELFTALPRRLWRWPMPRPILSTVVGTSPACTTGESAGPLPYRLLGQPSTLGLDTNLQMRFG